MGMILNSFGNFPWSFYYEDTKKTSKLKLNLSSFCSSVPPLGDGPQHQLQYESTGTKPNEHSLKYCYDDKMKTRQLKVSANWLWVNWPEAQTLVLRWGLINICWLNSKCVWLLGDVQTWGRSAAPTVPWQWIEKSGMKCIIYELTTGSQSCFVIEHVPCADICLATMEQRVSSKGFPCCLDILCDTGHHRMSGSTTLESSYECKSPRCSAHQGQEIRGSPARRRAVSHRIWPLCLQERRGPLSA